MKKLTKILVFLSFTMIAAGCSAIDTDELNNLIKELEDKNSALIEENDTIKKENNDLNNELNEFKNDDLASIITSLRSENETLNQTITSLNSQLNQLNQDLNSSNLINSSNQLKIDELNNLIKNLNAELEENILKIENINYRLDLAKENKFEIIYINSISEETRFKLDKSLYNSLSDALDENFTVSYDDTSYGKFIKKINDSFIDKNWYINIKENFVNSETGIDGITLDSGDVFEFSHICWNNELDDVDKLVDKIIYDYKDILRSNIETTETYLNSTFWDFLTVNVLKDYDQEAFGNYKFSDKLIDKINQTDVSTLSDANIGKYYYTARIVISDLTNFEEQFRKYNFDKSFSEYTTPFMIGPAYSLGLTELDSIQALVNTDYVAGTKSGPDGYCWQYALLPLFKEVNENVLDIIKPAYYTNGTSTALPLMVYAALNKSARDYEADGLDQVEILLNEYYDKDLKLVKYKKTDTKPQMSTNQIYASLACYKANRDSKKAVSIFA